MNERAIAIIQEMLDSYVHEHCVEDPETGVWESGGRSGEEYMETLEEIIEALRADMRQGGG